LYNSKSLQGLSRRKSLLWGVTRTKRGSNMSSKENCGEMEELRAQLKDMDR